MTYANILVIMTWTDAEAPNMDGLARQHQEYSLASFLRVYVSAVEKLTQNLPEQSKKGLPHSHQPMSQQLRVRLFLFKGKVPMVHTTCYHVVLPA